MDALVTPHSAHLLLQWLLALTAISSAALLLILPLRPLLRRLGGPALAYAAWALLPLALLATALPHPARGPAAMPFTQSAAPAAVGDSPLLVVSDAPPLLSDAGWLALWLAGSLSMLAFMAWHQVRLQRNLGRLQAAGHPGVYRTSHSGTGPLVLGLLRPRIVLPVDFAQRYTAQEQALVLAHEHAHLRRADLPANALACVLQALWWFNPLVHWAAACLRFDQELACDQVVLRRHPGQRQAYAHAILKTQLATQATAVLPPLACHWQPRHPVKERIMQLTRPHPGRAPRSAVRALLLAGAMACGLGAWAAVADLDAAPAPALATPAQTLQAAIPPVAQAAPAAEAAPAAAALPATAPQTAVRAKTAAPAKALGAAAADPRPTAANVAPLRVAVAEQQPRVLPAQSSPAAQHEAAQLQAAQALLPVAPAMAASSAAADAPAYYALSITQRTETRNADGVLLTSQTMRPEPIRVRPGTAMSMAYGPQAQHCDIGVRTSPAPDNMVEFVMNLKCQDTPVSSPRVRTRLGVPATVEISEEDARGRVAHKFWLLVDAAAEG